MGSLIIFEAIAIGSADNPKNKNVDKMETKLTITPGIKTTGLDFTKLKASLSGFAMSIFTMPTYTHLYIILNKPLYILL